MPRHVRHEHQALDDDTLIDFGTDLVGRVLETDIVTDSRFPKRVALRSDSGTSTQLGVSDPFDGGRVTVVVG